MEDQTPEGRYGLGRVAVLAHLQDIQKELSEGYTVRHIYNKRKDSLNEISYSQFARHIQRYIRNERPQKRVANPDNGVGMDTQDLTLPEGKSDKPFAQKFDFNPVAPDYQDLI